MTYDQDSFVDYNALVTGNSDSGLDATDESFIGVIQEATLMKTQAVESTM